MVLTATNVSLCLISASSTPRGCSEVAYQLPSCSLKNCGPDNQLFPCLSITVSCFGLKTPLEHISAGFLTPSI